MIHPSYNELMKVVNNNAEYGEEPVVNSRYSIVIASAKRARQIIGGAEPLVPNAFGVLQGSIVVSADPMVENTRDIFKITINGGTK